MSSDKIKTISELQTLLDRERKTKTIGLVAGCFDILHIGHIHLFREAKKKADIVVVELENDENIRTLKGRDRPIHSIKYRADVLSELSSIDYIFFIERTFTTDSTDASHYYEGLIEMVKPDYIFTAAKKDKYREHKQSYAQKNGLQLVEIEPLHLTSTTEILDKLISIE